MTDKNSLKLVLGSSSPRRLQLFHQIGLTPDVVQGADIDETVRRGELPGDYCLRVALEKNAALAGQFPGHVILTADTTVALGRRIIGKAEDVAEAERIVRMLSGRTHRVYTAVAVCGPNGKTASRVCESRVKVKRLTDHEIRNFLQTDDWQGTAGAYKVQGLFAQFILTMQGTLPNVMGLPLYETVQLLKGAGYDHSL